MLGAFLLVSLISIFIGCKKTELETTPISNSTSIKAAIDRNELPIDPFTTEKVQIVNGLMAFDDMATYRQVREALSILYFDQAFENDLYVENGYTEDDNDIVYRAFEDRFNFISARRVEEQEELLFLENGGDPIDFEGHFKRGAQYKSFLNPQAEFMIGDCIIKHISRYVTVYLLDGDMQRLEDIRNTPIENLKNEYNLRVINDAHPDGYSDVFEIDANGQIVDFRGECQISFRVHTCDNIYTFENTSTFDPNETYVFEWVINGVSHTSTKPYFFPTYYFGPPSLVGPIEVSLTVTGGDCSGTITKTVTPCNANQFLAVQINETTWRFTSDFNNTTPTYLPLPPPFTLTWDYGDGSQVTTQESTSAFLAPIWVQPYSVTHTFPAGFAEYEVTLTISHDRYDCSGESSMTVNAGCEGFRDIDEKEEHKNSDSNWQRKIISKHSTESEMGEMYLNLETESWEWKANWAGFVNWRLDKVDSLYVGYEGSIKDNCLVDVLPGGTRHYYNANSRKWSPPTGISYHNAVIADGRLYSVHAIFYGSSVTNNISPPNYFFSE